MRELFTIPDQINTEIITLASFILVLLLTIVVATLVNRFFVRLIKKSTAELNNDPTNYQFLRRVIVVGIYFVGGSIAIYMVPALRSLASSMLAGAGILAVAIGFASQQALSNVISGFFIVIFKPFRVNDRIKIKDMMGVVEDITLRHVIIRDFENKRIVIPNSLISNESVVNSDLVDDKVCNWVDIGISYNSDIQQARTIIQKEILAHPLLVDTRSAEAINNGDDIVPVRVINLGDHAIQLRAWAWTNNSVDGFQMTCDLLESIKIAFDESGVEIPYPQTDVHLRSDDTK